MSDDADLLVRWRDGDLAAGEALFDRYYPMVERFFINKLASKVDDMVQETFKVCVESRDKVAQPGRFRSFIMTVAYRVLCAHLRTRYRPGAATVDLATVSVHSLSPSPSSVAAERREHRLLLEGLRAIPATYQVILELHYWEEMTTAEIGAVLEVPVGTIRSRLKRARELLEQEMARLARTPDELQSTLSRLEDWAQECREQLA